jgi:hypothetical protein
MMRRVVVCVCTAIIALSGVRSVAAADDIVAYASDVTTTAGNWARVADSSAAGGQKMSAPDDGWSAIDAPLASPDHYFEISFDAPSGTPYRVWARMRASGNSKWNDSAWMQFGDAVSSNGTPLYRTGSGTGLLLNLEPCGNCGTSGWGWVGGAYWLSQVTVVQFAASGRHTLRVQTREDGVQIDQIVLSPSSYVSGAPGSGSNDATILSHTLSGGGGSGLAFLGAPVSLPGTVNAQDFDTAGDGISYHDRTPGNSGGVYRNTDIDLEPSTDGGNDIGWTEAGEWLNYSVNVTAPGDYIVKLRVASPSGGASMHVGFNGSDVWKVASIPATGGWQSWATVDLPVRLNAGPQLLTLLFDTGGFNINRITVVNASGSGTGGAAGGSTGGSSTPYSGTPIAIPGTLEAEYFDNGGEGVAYHDGTGGNAGGALRSSDVDLEAASGGGYNVGWVSPGEWLQYTVNVASGGSYTAQFRVASLGQGHTFHLEMNGANVSGAIRIPDTGGWQNWQTVTATVQLNAGRQVARLVIDSNGAGGGGNIDRVQFSAGTSGPGTAGGSTISVGPGDNLPAAIAAAKPGDTILLTPGAVYAGGLLLPAKDGDDYITIRSAASDSSLPADGVRITPAYAGQLPKIQGGNAGLPAVRTDHGAHHWRLQFLELIDTYPYGDIVQLGDGSTAQNSLASVAHDLILDRVYVHGLSEQKRAIALNSASTTIKDSYISDIKLANGDAQAIGGWNGPGPYTITNNHLEAAGENVLFGGSDPSIYGLVPSDIVFRRNTITKQESWRYQGYTVKNLIEFKNAQRVTIDGNIIEYNWAAGQSGYAIMLTPGNQGGTAPWTVVQQVSITNNVIRHVASVMNILGSDYRNTSQTLTDVVFRNNLVVDLSRANWSGAAQLLLTNGGSNITFDHNTVFTDGSSTVYADGAQVSGFVFTNNIIPDNLWGVMGGGSSEGSRTLSDYYPNAMFLGNVVIGAQTSLYPTGNFYPDSLGAVGFERVRIEDSLGAVGFVDASGNYRLSGSSPYANGATDGGAVGANIAAINAAAGTSY